MSKKTVKQPTLKSLEKDCSSIDLNKQNQTLLVTSPCPSAMLASAILSRAILKLGKRFHISFSEPVLKVDKVNSIRQKYDSSTVIFVGIDILGTSRIKKGSSYPIIIGGMSESEQAESLKIGTDLTLTAVAYTLVKSSVEPADYDLQLAAGGALIDNEPEKSAKSATRELVDLAKSANLLEERKGFRLLGVSLFPLDEVFLYSTHPYLKDISGNQKACDSLLNEAEIPVPKLRTSLSDLSTSEAQRLTSKLIPKLDPLLLPRLLGKDYEFLKERESSPIRHLSGIEIIGTTSWIINELGAFMSILLGDRGRALRLLLDSHMTHHKDVISTIQYLEVGLETDSTTSATILKVNGLRNELLPDIGRITIETGIVDTDRPVALDNSDSFIITWPSPDLSVKEVSQKILTEGIELIATSSKSIKILGDTQEKERGLQIVSEMNKERG